MKQRLTDDHQECLQCRVPDECQPRHALCGISRGMKYEIYRADSHSRASSGLPEYLTNFCTCGFKEVPLFRQRSGMHEFCNAVAKYQDANTKNLSEWGHEYE